MTNKLPEVGKRYRHNLGAVFLVTERKEGTVVSGGGVLLNNVEDGFNDWFSVRDNDYSEFWRLFKELTGENPNTNEVKQNDPCFSLGAEGKISKKKEVDYQFAKEDLEKELEQLEAADCFFEPKYTSEDLLQKQLARLMDKAQNLLNALNDIKTQVEPVVDKAETKLPWKVADHYFNGYERHLDAKTVFWDESKGVITVADLINSIESMLSRQDELEERVKKLDGKND